MPAPSFSQVWPPRPLGGVGRRSQRARCRGACRGPRAFRRASGAAPGVGDAAFRARVTERRDHGPPCPWPGTCSAGASRGPWSWHRPARCRSGSARRRSSPVTAAPGEEVGFDRLISGLAAADTTGPIGWRHAARWRCGVGSSMCSPHRARNRCGLEFWGDEVELDHGCSPWPVSDRSSLRPRWSRTRPASSAPKGEVATRRAVARHRAVGRRHLGSPGRRARLSPGWSRGSRGWRRRVTFSTSCPPGAGWWSSTR